MFDFWRKGEGWSADTRFTHDTLQHEDRSRAVIDAKLPPYDGIEDVEMARSAPFLFDQMPYHAEAYFKPPMFKLDPCAVGKVSEIREHSSTSTPRQFPVTLSVLQVTFKGNTMKLRLELEYPADELLQVALRISCTPHEAEGVSSPWFTGATTCGTQR